MSKEITQEFLESATALSRMYGAAETLEPLPNIPQEKLFPILCDWTAELIHSKEDITDFLYRKIETLK